MMLVWSVKSFHSFGSHRRASFSIGLVSILAGGLLWVDAAMGASANVRPASVERSIDLQLQLLVTLSSVIGLGFVLGRLLRWVGQPPVIGEVLAGILLGPSLLGWVWPSAAHQILPGPDVDPQGKIAAALEGLALLGVVLYMFLLGLELNGARLRRQVRLVVMVSQASIIIPLSLGSLLAWGLYDRLASPEVPELGFVLFLGAAMSVTAFPVLARILTDLRLVKTELGTIALGSAAAQDVTAWCLLAMVVGVVRSEMSGALGVILLATGFLAIMFGIVRPILTGWLARFEERPGPLPSLVVTVVFLTVLGSAMLTEAIGIHAIFGSFVLGAIVPSESRIAHDFSNKLHDPVTVLLLPAFFAYTGLRTDLGLVGGLDSLGLTVLVIGVATFSKFVGTLLASRATGGSWALSSALGVLMNTRGLMELIVLHIGLELGIIGPRLFAMMVVMAIVTTLITSPVLRAIVRQNPSEPAFQTE
jgi:Kef-type K+ transport system membrane component KefB